VCFVQVWGPGLVNARTPPPLTEAPETRPHPGAVPGLARWPGVFAALGLVGCPALAGWHVALFPPRHCFGAAEKAEMKLELNKQHRSMELNEMAGIRWGAAGAAATACASPPGSAWPAPARAQPHPPPSHDGGAPETWRLPPPPTPTPTPTPCPLPPAPQKRDFAEPRYARGRSASCRKKEISFRVTR
jgi:hypothetical protein